MLQNLLSTIMDLPYPLSLNEAKKKLIETYVIINNELGLLMGLDEDGLVYASLKGTISVHKDHVKSLEVFLPETGVYSNGNTSLLLTKLPKRQWKKSFSFDFYTIDIPYNSNIVFWIFDNKNTRLELCRLKDSIYYLDKKVGSINKMGNIIITNPMYAQEIVDKTKKDFSWKIETTN